MDIPADVVTASPETIAWQDALGEQAESMLHALPHFAPLRASIAELAREFTVFPPVPRGPTKWFQRVMLNPDDSHPALVVSDSPGAPGRTLIDCNALSAEKGRPVILDWFEPSPDGALVAVALSEAGLEKSVATLRSADTGEVVRELEWDIPMNPSWLPDASGFWFCERVLADGMVNMVARRYLLDGTYTAYHMPGLFQVPRTSDDGRSASVRTGNTEVRTDHIIRDGVVVPFLHDVPGQHSGSIIGDTWIGVVSSPNGRGRVVSIPLDSPADQSTWAVLLDESDDVVWNATLVAGRLVIGCLRDGSAALRVLATTGAPLALVELPYGTISTFPLGAAHSSLPMFNHGTGPEIAFLHSTFDRSPAVYTYDVVAGVLTEVAPPEIVLPDITVERVWTTSSDGTRVPASIVYKSSLDRSRPQPALVHGYGGFNLAWLPFYLGGYAAFVEAGGIYCHMHLRGGGEFGAEWWVKGRREHKQQTFDDMFAIASELISSGVTSAAQMAVQGESNGGLLAGSAVVQRPDLWAAVVADVPILDVLGVTADPVSYAIARDEYGDPLVEEDAAFMRKWSPIELVREGDSYPPTLFIVGENDPRCPAWHSRKLIALMWAASPSAPLWLRVHKDQGHGASVPGAVIDRTAEWMAFVAAHTGLRV